MPVELEVACRQAQLKELVASIVGDYELASSEYEFTEEQKERYRRERREELQAREERSGFTVVCLPHYLCCGIQSSCLVAAWWNCTLSLVATWWLLGT